MGYSVLKVNLSKLTSGLRTVLPKHTSAKGLNFSDIARDLYNTIESGEFAEAEDYVLKFAQVWNVMKQQKSFIRSRVIDRKSVEWPMMETVAKLAQDFCDSFELEPEEGFAMFVETCYEFFNSKNIILNKIRFNYEKICELFIAKMAIEDDYNPALTDELVSYYLEKLAIEEGSLGLRGISYTRKDPLEFLYFVKAKDIAQEAKLTVQEYIDSQFEGLSWRDRTPYPRPDELVDYKSTKRLREYLLNKAPTKSRKKLIKKAKR